MELPYTTYQLARVDTLVEQRCHLTADTRCELLSALLAAMHVDGALTEREFNGFRLKLEAFFASR